jgi:hypothetical protein
MNGALSPKHSLHVQRDHHDLAASNGIKKDPLRAGEYLAQLREFLVTFHSSDLIYADRQLEPLYVAQRVAQDLRRCTQRIIADRIGYAALAAALEFLDPTCDVPFMVNESVVLHHPGASLEQVSVWEGPRNYWWSGDWARIATALEAVLIDCFAAAIRTFPEDHLATLHYRNKVITEEYGELCSQIYRQEDKLNRHDTKLLEEPYDEKLAISFQARKNAFVANIGRAPDRANNGLQADFFNQFPSNYIGMSASVTTMLEAAMAALVNADVPVDQWSNVLVAANAEFSVTAAVVDAVGNAVCYTHREPNPFHVETVDYGFRLVYRRPDLAVQAEKIAKLAHLQLGKTTSADCEIMYGRGRCPSNESLEPSGDEQQLCQRASLWLVDLLGPAYSNHLADMTSANGFALLSTVLAGRLLASEKILPPKRGHVLENLPQLLTQQEELQFRRLAAGATAVSRRGSRSDQRRSRR